MSEARVNTSLEVITPPPRHPGGRPSSRTAAITEEICDRLSEGEPLAKIARDEHMPNYSTLKRWQRDDPEFRAVSARAKLDGTHYLAEDSISISDAPLHFDPETARIELMQRKLQIDTRLRLIGKWNSRAYGEKVQVETVEVGKELAPDEIPGGLGFLARARLEGGGK